MGNRQDLEDELDGFLRDGVERNGRASDIVVFTPPEKPMLTQTQTQTQVQPDLEELGVKVLVASDEYDQKLIEERNQAMRQIHADVQALADIQSDLAELTFEQAPLVDAAADDVEQAERSTHEGVLELAEANKKKASSRTLMTTLTSVAVGAGVGTLAGLTGGPPGMLVGAVLGAAVGGGVGYGAGRVLDNSKQIDAELRAHAHAKGWVGGSKCMRCKSEFNLLLRRHHHCRACGGVFCDKCSSQKRHVYYEGLEHPVHTRVCDTCIEVRPPKFVAPRDRALYSTPLAE
eukprot:CAMPEP_0174231756 /NCGR_PEP_ID=MMETSP0417-20130205/2208_1 /TAXON_ID=242541 /ORGANISM="Mayorella sp, Strain BSH-02190019" /LENGTH=288 /DNA_ID=CAMNT_0015309693 /DNA_START=122 /DNA_END=988 /DNA_ORIENTATION=-